MSTVQAIGERLREARERLGLDVVQVEAATKIRAKYLRALEGEEFDLLPGPTFVKTFLRTYAEYLGLDAQLLVEEYRAQYEPRAFEAQPLAPPRRRERQRRAPRGPSGPPGPGTALLVALAVLIAIFAILGITKGGSSSSSSTTSATTATTPRRPTTQPARRPPPPVPTTVVLTIAPVNPTYLCVDRGQGTTPLVNNVVSQPQRFTGKHLRINAGMSSVRLTANGKRVAVPQTNNPIGYDFTPGHATPIPPGPQRPCVG